MAETVPTKDPEQDKVLGTITDKGFVPTNTDQEVGAARPPRSTGTKMWERAWGTDVEDPYSMTRMGSILAGSLGLGVAGAKVGAVAGSPLGPVGAGAGAVIGGAAGGLAGAAAGVYYPEAAVAAGEALGLIDEGSVDPGLSQQELKTVLEGELLLEMATGGGLAVARMGGRAATRLFTGVGKQGSKLAEDAARDGIALLPVQIGSRRIPRGFVSVLGRFAILAGPIRKQGTAAEKSLKEAFDKLPARIAPVMSMTEVSRSVMDDAADMAKHISSSFDKRYNDLWTRADAAGVTIDPKLTIQRAEDILTRIGNETPKTATKAQTIKGPASLEQAKLFIKRNVIPITKVSKAGNRRVSMQSLKQMDGMLRSIDEEISSIIKDQGMGPAVNMLEDLRNAVQLDMAGNLASGSNQTQRAIAEEVSMLDAQFSSAVSEMLETAAANKFGSVKRGGLRSLQDIQKATRTPVDATVEMLLRGDSPQVMTDLHKMIKPETFKRVAASVLDSKIESSLKFQPGGSSILDASMLRRQLGIGKPNSKRYAQMSKMLELSGGLDIKDVERLLDAADAVGSLEIPKVSQFIARRATLGGVRGITGAIIPSIAAGGAAGGAAAAGAGVTVTGGIAAIGFILGSRGLAKAISNPNTSRYLHRVLAPEGKHVAKRYAIVQTVRFGIQAMMEDGDITAEEGKQMLDSGMEVLRNSFREIQDRKKNAK